jgi:hypothetical protein
MHQILNLIFYLSTNNLDIIFFIYGLAFFVMGISILIVPKKESTFKLSGILWPLAWFGLIHGLNEWLDMWEMIKYKGDLINAVRGGRVCLDSLKRFLSDKLLCLMPLPASAVV